MLCVNVHRNLDLLHQQVCVYMSLKEKSLSGVNLMFVGGSKVTQLDVVQYRTNILSQMLVKFYLFRLESS